MTLRLVLVSLVAAMGLTVPSAPVIESWVASTQNWMNARFADWDTRNPQTADYVIVSDYYDVERLAPRPAKSSLPAIKNKGNGVVPPKLVRQPSAAVRFDPKPLVNEVDREIRLMLVQCGKALGSVVPAVVLPATSPRRIEPVAVAKNPGGVIADKLIQQSRGIGINPPLAVAPRPAAPSAPLAPVASAPRPVATKPATPAVASAPRPVATKPATPAVASAPRTVANKPARPALASQTSFGQMETSASLYFAGMLTPPAKSVLPTSRWEPTKSSATPVAVRPPLSPKATEARELPDDVDSEVAGELVWQDDGFGAPARAAKAPVTAAKPRSEPLEFSCDYYVGTVFELDFRNDGLSIPARPAVRTAKTDMPAPHSGRDLSRAVTLTRDAVYAWVNVFTGPALVTVSQSN